MELVNTFPAERLINASFSRNLLCASYRILQMKYLSSIYGDKFPLTNICSIPKIPDTTMGKRKEFILKYGYNLFDFSTWM